MAIAAEPPPKLLTGLPPLCSVKMNTGRLPMAFCAAADRIFAATGFAETVIAPPATACAAFSAGRSREMVAASLLIRTSVTPALIRASTDCSVRVAVMSLAPLVVVASMVTETPFFSVPAFFAASCAALMASVTDFQAR